MGRTWFGKEFGGSVSVMNNPSAMKSLSFRSRQRISGYQIARNRCVAVCWDDVGEAHDKLKRCCGVKCWAFLTVLAVK